MKAFRLLWVVPSLVLTVCAVALGATITTELGEGSSAVSKMVLTKNIVTGDVILLDKGDPSDPDIAKKPELWSDVLRFTADANGVVTATFISDADPADLFADQDLSKLVLQENRVFKPESGNSITLYSPGGSSQPGFDMNPDTTRNYRLLSDAPEGPEPGTLLLVTKALAIGAAAAGTKRAISLRNGSTGR